MSLHLNKMASKSWLVDIAQNKELWAKGEMEDWPSIIAYEYQRLRRLCEKEQSYGVLLCLRDNFESFLKLEVLLSFAWADQYTDEEFRKNVVCQITTQNLSLGQWVELATILIRETVRAGFFIPEEIPLKEVVHYYNKLKIVNWRNRKIGHGAMEFDEDEEFQNDLKQKILELAKLYTTFNKFLKLQSLYIDETLLKGPDMARDLKEAGEVWCHLKGSEIKFNANPYLLIREHEKRGKGVYFFDNQKTRTLTSLQAYADGSQVNERVSHFEGLRIKLETANLRLSARTDDPYLTEAENRELEILQMNHSFVEPTYLTHWLQGCVERQDKGIFLLQMERGIGKSVFSDKLNRLYNGALVIEEDLDVRTYHYSRTQSVGIEDIYSRIEWAWANEYRGDFSWQIRRRILDYEKEGASSAVAFSKFLGAVREYTQTNRNRSRILMVLDGLDEIMEEKVWDMLPTSDMLPEGVFILLTSRIPEIENGLPRKLNELSMCLNVTEKFISERTRDDNINFLKQYIRKSSIGEHTEETIQDLLKKADYRVLYLGMLCKLVEQGMDINNFLGHEKVVEVYLRAIDRSYGEREAIRIREVLAVLTTMGSFEPLHLSEIAGLTAEGLVTLKMIGMMRDLAPMLKIERGSDGNLYKISNPDLAESLIKQLPEEEETINSLIKLGIDQIEAGYPAEIPAVEVVIAHIADLIMKDQKVNGFLSRNVLEKLDLYASKAWENATNVKDRKRARDYRKQHVLSAGMILGEDHTITINSMNILGDEYYSLGFYKEEVALRERVLSIQKNNNGEEHPDTLQSMNNLGNSYCHVGRYREAAEMLENALEIRKRVLGAEDPDTLQSMDSLGNSISLCGQYKEALKIQEKVLEIRTRVLGDKHPDTLNSMTHLGITYRALGRYTEAIAVFEQELKTQMLILSKEHPDTLRTMDALGTAYSSIGYREEAVELFDEIVQIRKRVLGETHPDTLKSMNYLGNAYGDSGNYEEAIKVYKKTIDLQRRVLGQDHPDTLNSMNNLGNIYYDYGYYPEALEIDEKALLIRKKALGEDHPDTLANMKNLGETLWMFGHYEEAIALLKHSLEVRERFLGKDHLDTRENMITLSCLYREYGRQKESRTLNRKWIMSTLYAKRKRGNNSANKKTAKIISITLLIEIMLSVLGAAFVGYLSRETSRYLNISLYEIFMYYAIPLLLVNLFQLLIDIKIKKSIVDRYDSFGNYLYDFITNGVFFFLFLLWNNFFWATIMKLTYSSRSLVFVSILQTSCHLMAYKTIRRFFKQDYLDSDELNNYTRKRFF